MGNYSKKPATAYAANTTYQSDGLSELPKDDFYNALEVLTRKLDLFMLEKQSTDSMIWVVLGGVHSTKKVARIDGFNCNEKQYYINQKVTNEVGA
jgi:hypothetical protein